MMQFGIVTLFPDMFAALNYGIIGRAIKNALISINISNPREFTTDKHQTVDDRPYGGGAGMVMMVEPLQQAILHLKKQLGTSCTTLLLSPQGQRLSHQHVIDLSQQKNLILVCGRYEGIDERLVELAIDAEYSIGDYVLSGGEFAAMVTIDAISRQIPAVLGHEHAAQDDSFAQGLLDYPHFTRPDVYANIAVPKVLRQGNHQAIKKWRKKQALGKTWLKRPDLLEKYALSEEERQLLDEFISELAG